MDVTRRPDNDMGRFEGEICATSRSWELFVLERSVWLADVVTIPQGLVELVVAVLRRLRAAEKARLRRAAAAVEEWDPVPRQRLHLRLRAEEC